MLGSIKRFVFLSAKYAGVFALTRWLYRKRVRFLCYHGFSLDDEASFLPQLFIDPEVFSTRMRYLKDNGYNVITLQEAMESLSNDSVTDNSVVLTIDDGFFGVLAKATPILRKFDFPATLYLTSYYFDRDCPIYSLAVKYLFWRAGNEEEDLTGLEIPGLQQSVSVDNRQACIDLIIDYGQALDDNEGRVQLLRQIASLLGQDYDELNKSRVMGLINTEELAELMRAGIDIQMHTHRHIFPLDTEKAAQELKKNRSKVDPLLPAPMTHFCYPSGMWSHEQWKLLEEEQITSATTCLPGLMGKNMNPFAIPRFLDGANISQIDFESEMTGFSELCRKFRFRNTLKSTQ